MSHHMPRKHSRNRRQEGDLGLNVADASGIDGAISIVGTALGTALIADTGAAAKAPIETGAPEVDGLVPLESVIILPPTASVPLPTALPTTSAVSSAGASISIATVVAACVGAFFGAALIILLGVCLYRRSLRSVRKPSTRSSPAWNRLEGGDDKWENMKGSPEQQQPPQKPVVAPLEEMSMFKGGSSSIKSEKTSENGHLDFSGTPFAQYHPKLAEELAALPSPRAFVARAEPAVSWGGDTLANEDSYTIPRPSHLSTGAMSPTSPIALPTPAIVSSQLHRWESAEVLHFDASAADESKNPFADNKSTTSSGTARRSLTSAYFSAGPEVIRKSPSKRGTSRSRSRSRSNSYASKEAIRNPFGDDNAAPDFDMPVPHPYAAAGLQDNHSYHSSTPSAGSSQAMASLIAALDATPKDESRLRVVSMQPSFVSAQSEYVYDDSSEVRPHGSQHLSMQPSFVSSNYGDEDITAFPLPPSNTSTSTLR